MSKGQKNRVRTKCFNCGDQIVVPKHEVAEHGDRLFCQDCLIQTECRTCGRSMQTTHDKFAQFNGKPICKDCTSGTINQAYPIPKPERTDVIGRRIIGAVIDVIAIFIGGIVLSMGVSYIITELAGVTISYEQESMIYGAGMVFTYVYNFIYLEAAGGSIHRKIGDGNYGYSKGRWHVFARFFYPPEHIQVH